MKLLVLTQYYPPETGAPQNRYADLTRRLAARGHDVEVITALPNYPTTSVLEGYEGRANTVETLAGVRVARVDLHVPRNRSTRERIRCYGSFAMNVARYGPRLVNAPDVIVMESPPLTVALAGVRLARYFRVPLVTNVSDLWPDSITAVGVKLPAVALKAARALEMWMYRNSALILGQTQGIVDDIKTRVETRVELFPNGADIAAYQPPLARDVLRAEFGWAPDQFVVGYAGVIGMAQALDQIIDAAKLLPSNLPVHVALFGDGPEKDRLIRRVEQEGIANTRLYGRLPSERMPHLQAAFDAGLVPLANQPLFEGARPSKMFEIMAAARPLVVCARGEAPLIAEHGAGGKAGIVVPPEDPQSLATALEWLAQHPTEATEMGKRGRITVEQDFDRDRIAERIEQLLLSVANRKPLRAKRAVATKA